MGFFPLENVNRGVAKRADKIIHEKPQKPSQLFSISRRASQRKRTRRANKPEPKDEEARQIDTKNMHRGRPHARFSRVTLPIKRAKAPQPREEGFTNFFCGFFSPRRCSWFAGKKRRLCHCTPPLCGHVGVCRRGVVSEEGLLTPMSTRASSEVAFGSSRARCKKGSVAFDAGKQSAVRKA